jgi:hypothetical protein
MPAGEGSQLMDTVDKEFTSNSEGLKISTMFELLERAYRSV